MYKKGKKRVLWGYIERSSTIILTTHVRPDGDGIASELALYMILKLMGKEVYILNQDKTPDMYSWLPFSSEILTIAGGQGPIVPNADLVILLDCSGESRIGGVANIVASARWIVSLDHHEDTECYRDYCYVDTSASSIGELLILLIPDVWDKIDREIATCIYVSILTDTGSFAYGNTTPRVLRIASRLLEYGVKPEHAYRMVYNNKTLTHFRLLGKTLERLMLDETGKVAWVLLPLSVYQETGAREEDHEGILEVIRGLKNVELIILLRQLQQGIFKVSLRSEDRINCNYLAKLFGGGGHFKASGFIVKGNINEDGHTVIKRIMEEIKQQGWI